MADPVWRIGLFAVGLLVSCFAGASEPAQDDPLHEVHVMGQRERKVSVAGKLPVRLAEIPQSISVVDAEAITDRALTSIDGALRGVTGVAVIPNSESNYQIRSRGYGMSAMNDGVPRYSSLSGYQQFDLALYDSVEVLRGPAGLLQGTGDAGGSVNLVSKRARAQPAMDLSATAGRWDFRRATLDATGPLNDDATLRGRTALVWQQRDSFLEWNQDQRRAGYGTLDWDATSGTLVTATVAAQHESSQGSHAGNPAELETGRYLDVPRSANITPPWARSASTKTQYALSLRQMLPANWTARANVSVLEEDSFFQDAFAATGVRMSDYTVPMRRRKFDYFDQWSGADVFLSGPVRLWGREHSMLLGYNFDSYVSRNAGIGETTAQALRVRFDRRADLPPLDLPYATGSRSETGQRGLYAQARMKAADSLTLLLGTRLSSFKVRSQDRPPSKPTVWRMGQRLDSEWVPYAGVVYAAQPHVSLYASYSSMFFPQSTQLRADGTPLDPRVGAQYEVGSKATLFEGHLDIALSAFMIQDHDRSLVDPANPGFFINAGLVRSRGWEVETQASPWQGMKLQASYSHLATRYVRSTVALQGTPFDLFMPRNLWSLWATQRFEHLVYGSWRAGIGMTGQSPVEPNPQRRQATYTLLDAMLAFKAAAGYEIQLNGTNLLDKVYHSRVGGLNSYNTIGTPRNVHLSVRFTL